MASSVHHYELYGLHIASTKALPSLRRLPGDFGTPDVNVVFEPSWPDVLDPQPGRVLRATRLLRVSALGEGEGTLLDFIDGPSFVVDPAGETIRVLAPEEGADDSVLRFLLGQVTGLVLRRRGTTCIHGAVLASRAGGLALAGPSGAGKSTVCAALLEEGLTLVSDDVLVVAEDEGDFVALPGIPRVRLWQDAADQLFEDAKGHPRLGDSGPKRLLDLSSDEARVHHGRCPLDAIYVLRPLLDAPPGPHLDRPEGGDVLMSLLANTYPNPEHIPLAPDVRARELDVLGRLVERVPVRRVSYARDLSQLPALCRTILSDFESLGSSASCPTDT